MTKKTLFHKILTDMAFLGKPLVLVDVGSSGGVFPPWKEIVGYSTLKEYDGGMGKIVTSGKEDTVTFYNTKSEFCSSTLEPDTELLKEWSHRSLFEVTNVSQLPTTKLDNEYIDWLKIDSQGTDLRLYQSFDNKDTLLALDLEPGITPAYKGEDGLYKVLEHMRTTSFWLNSMEVCGAKRMKGSDISINRASATAPMWTELSYFRKYEGVDRRGLLALFVFAVIKEHYGFAYDVALQGEGAIFDDMKQWIQDLAHKKYRIMKIKSAIRKFI